MFMLGGHPLKPLNANNTITDDGSATEATGQDSFRPGLAKSSVSSERAANHGSPRDAGCALHHHSGDVDDEGCENSAPDPDRAQSDNDESSDRPPCFCRHHDNSRLDFSGYLDVAEKHFRDDFGHGYWTWSQRHQNWFHGDSPETAERWYPEKWLQKPQDDSAELEVWRSDAAAENIQPIRRMEGSSSEAVVLPPEEVEKLVLY
ncbi:hypothetical protein MKZ38_009897 [Zalerion maritima]|uniref:Uncharacterized protein n=1 Tax=Zalerion maritima TaxID=339359 RepID=A0AAD5WNF6_9PEZI|nr:hypothetical protein MKZ38_009897 [Zalerion maritima]